MLRVGLGRITPINARTTPPASFLLSFADLGAGQVSTVEGVGNATPTFTRATVAWTKLSTGLWAQVNSGVPRSMYSGMDTTVGTFQGYLAEGARTNECLQARQGTATHWIATNITKAQTSTGIDGAGNSCFSLTGTGANGTCLQPIASTFTAAISRTFSAFVKRTVGVGAVAITVDGGATYSTVTPSINAATFTQVQVTGSVATATVGIKLVTSGDAVAVDMCQQEQATFASTPVPTTVAAVTRNADQLTYPTSPWFNSATGTFFAVNQFFDGTGAGTNFRVMQTDDGSNNNCIGILKGAGATMAATTNSGGVLQANMSTNAALTSNSTQKTAFAYAVNDFAAVTNAGTVQTDTSGVVAVGQSSLAVGFLGGGLNIQHLFGPISSIRYSPQRIADPVLQQMTT